MNWSPSKYVCLYVEVLYTRKQIDTTVHKMLFFLSDSFAAEIKSHTWTKKRNLHYARISLKENVRPEAS